MKIRTKITVLLLCAFAWWGVSLPATAQSQTTHWTTDVYAYQYDMTAYLSLAINGEPLEELRGCEIAAFCGDECRGVSEIMTVENGGQTVQYVYLRIRSNSAEGENITFKVYLSAMNLEYDIEDVSVAFQTLQVLGMPSSPMTLNVSIDYLKGDVNDDKQISIQDAVAIVDYILSDGKTPIVFPAADMNGDGQITIADAAAIVDYILIHY